MSEPLPVPEQAGARLFWPALAALVALGLALRLAAAQGGLWLDEAWSAVYARDVGTPLGVFLSIHHDNNHDLNTLWLQLAGWGAPPPLQRALSIVSGTAAIVLAGLYGRRRAPWAGIAAALLFAVSPILVTYGSEARGYAPMVLALLGLLLIVDRWLDTPDRPVPAVALALVTLLGMLAQLTFLFGLAAIIGMIAIHLALARPRDVAIRRGVAALAPILAGAGIALALVLLPARAQGGLAFGNLEPFSIAAWLHGLRQLFDYTLGSHWLFVPLLLLRPVAALPRWSFFVLLLVAFPIAIALVQLGNSGAARYFLPWSIAALLLVAELSGRALGTRGWRAGVAALLLIATTIASLMLDARTIANRRADPMTAIAALRSAAPAGATVLVDNPRASAVLDAAAASAGYRLQVQTGKCPPAAFLFSDLDGDDLASAVPVRCGGRYRQIAEGKVTALSGTHWRLYARLP